MNQSIGPLNGKHWSYLCCSYSMQRVSMIVWNVWLSAIFSWIPWRLWSVRPRCCQRYNDVRTRAILEPPFCQAAPPSNTAQSGTQYLLPISCEAEHKYCANTLKGEDIIVLASAGSASSAALGHSRNHDWESGERDVSLSRTAPCPSTHPSPPAPLTSLARTMRSMVHSRTQVFGCLSICRYMCVYILWSRK